MHKLYTLNNKEKPVRPVRAKIQVCALLGQFDDYCHPFITSLPHQICKMQPDKIVNVCSVLITFSNNHYWLTTRLQFSSIQLKLSNVYI